VTFDNSQSTNGAGDGYATATATDSAREIYDQLLALANEVAAAYVDAYQKTADGIAKFQDTVAPAGWSSAVSGGPGWQPGSANGDVGEPLSEAGARSFEIGEKLQEMNKKITLAYLNACELAALAVTDCQEELTATSGVELVKAVGGARVGFTREVTKACVSAAREIVREA
jgi:hypothetical protein